jgi:hypothetical protein
MEEELAKAHRATLGFCLMLPALDWELFEEDRNLVGGKVLRI